ncbi:MAG: methylated-DNA--[protein]-cysteine S-methyltransferase [Gammaproteobacteria bacterium]
MTTCTYDKTDQKMAAAIRRLQSGAPAALADAAKAVQMSPGHFQRQFKRWVGISPKQFAAALTLAQVKKRLAAGESILAAAWDAGLSGGGRAHDLFVGFEGATPGAFCRRGEGLSFWFGNAHTFLGAVFVAGTERGISLLRFADDAKSTEDNAAAFRAELAKRWPLAQMRADNKSAKKIAALMFADDNNDGNKIPLAVSGTNFQVNVWRALLAIPPGCVAGYGALARVIGCQKAARAVGRAAAANPVAVLIPCHRLLASNGAINERISGYEWGVARKRVLLAREFSGGGG